MPISRNRCAAFLLAAALTVLLAACGGDSDDATTTAELTKAEYIRQADTICSKTEQRQQWRVARFNEREMSPGPRYEVALVRSAGLPPLATQLQELRELSPPAGDAAEVGAYLQSFEAALRKAERDPATLLSLDSDPFAKAETLARSYGFEVCGGS